MKEDLFWKRNNYKNLTKNIKFQDYLWNWLLFEIIWKRFKYSQNFQIERLQKSRNNFIYQIKLPHYQKTT